MNALALPNPLFDYHQLFTLLLPIAALLAAGGLLAVFQQGTGPEQLRGIVQIAFMVALLAGFDAIVQAGKAEVHRMVEKDLKADPLMLAEKFTSKLMAGDDLDLKGTFYEQITKAGAVLFHTLLAVVITMVSLVAMVIFFLAYLAQELALEMGIGFAPLYVGFLFLPATRGIGIQFLLYMAAIVLFPLGWGAASLVSDHLVELATRHDAASQPAVASTLAYGMRNLFGSFLVAVWILISTAFAPFAILKGVTSGVHIGADAGRAALRIIRG